jgi:hypothetical protein
VDGAVLRLPYPCRCRSGQLPRRTVDGADSNRPIPSQYGRQRHWTALDRNVRTKLNQQLNITPQRWLFTQLASIEGVASDCIGLETEQTNDHWKYGSARASAPPPNAPPRRHPALPPRASKADDRSHNSPFHTSFEIRLPVVTSCSHTSSHCTGLLSCKLVQVSQCCSKYSKWAQHTPFLLTHHTTHLLTRCFHLASAVFTQPPSPSTQLVHHHAALFASPPCLDIGKLSPLFSMLRLDPSGLVGRHPHLLPPHSPFSCPPRSTIIKSRCSETLG